MLRFAKSLPAGATSRSRQCKPFLSASTTTTRNLQTVALQLDYYMSAQFAGIACAMTNQLYENNGIKLKFLPICPVGLELERVHANSKVAPASTVTLGSVEQNIFIPTLYENPSLNLKAVAAMFRRSPLCLASKSTTTGNNNQEKLVVGAHEDTVSLLQRILAEETQYTVKASPRSTKNTDLMSGDLDAIQAYLTTEVPTLQRKLGTDAIDTLAWEGLNGAKLGYAQVLFAPEQDLIVDKREVVEAFLDATFQGWNMAIRDHESAAQSVNEAMSILRLDDEANDHWDSSLSYQVQNVGLCCDFVKETFQGDRYGVINATRWNEATEWLLADSHLSGDTSNFGIDTTVWQPSPQLLAGNELARTMLEKAKAVAGEFTKIHSRKPSLAVITLGELSRYTDAKKRLDIYSNKANSWFNKTLVGEANGFDVTEIGLSESTSTDELLSELYALKSYDGIQLMWPLPEHIDSAKVYNAISVAQDVDGAHYIGQVELGAKCPMPPVTPATVVALLDEYDIDLKNKSVLVIGRSRIVGSPVGHMLRAKGAIVTIAHAEVAPNKLESLCRDADIIVSCAGSPGLLKAGWVKEGAEIINVGATFCNDTNALVSDFDGDLAQVAERYSPVPGGIGPLSVASLFQNVAEAAWRRASIAKVESTWETKSGSLARSIHFEDYDSALEFAGKVNAMSATIDHHANMTFSHKCVNGVDVDLSYFTFEANQVTDKDYQAAQLVDDIILESASSNEEVVRMSDFAYELNPDSIAKYPAEPRGSSRLIRVDEHGDITHFDNFSESFLSMAQGAHIVFNESGVANGRLLVAGNGIENLEMMILDLGDTVGNNNCSGLKLNVMLRQEGVEVGMVFSDKDEHYAFKVVEAVGPWIEDEDSNGNGTECIVECQIIGGHTDAIPLADLLDKIGTMPIPPYMDRLAEDSDTAAYNNVYAAMSSKGSVAAPTAGLHFTDELMENIGHVASMSFLKLHVGAGTFQPVATDNAMEHKMHGETFAVNVGEIRRIIQVLESGKRMIVIGTTSARTLESMYWCGVKLLSEKAAPATGEPRNDDQYLVLGQRECYDLAHEGANISAADALNAIVIGKNDEETISGRTSLMIVPDAAPDADGGGGYNFQVVNELVTNFHAPDSTLILLVSAFLGSGRKVKSVYMQAQESGYKFLSYGDVCYFSRPKKE